MCNFRVGQKVVCINGQVKSSFTTNGWAPSTGGVYTVRGVVIGSLPRLLLEEYLHPDLAFDGFERGWDALRFRPVQERGTDISIFKEMLKPSKQEVLA